MQNPKPHDGFFFAPAAQFKVVMDGRHSEEAAAEEVATEDLDDDAAELYKKYKAKEGEE